jgi:hypothetical protein
MVKRKPPIAAEPSWQACPRTFTRNLCSRYVPKHAHIHSYIHEACFAELVMLICMYCALFCSVLLAMVGGSSVATILSTPKPGTSKPTTQAAPMRQPSRRMAVFLRLPQRHECKVSIPTRCRQTLCSTMTMVFVLLPHRRHLRLQTPWLPTVLLQSSIQQQQTLRTLVNSPSCRY